MKENETNPDDPMAISLDKAILLTAKEIKEGDYAEYFMVWTFHENDQIGCPGAIAGEGDRFACFATKADAIECAASRNKRRLKHLYSYPVKIADEIRYIKAMANGMTEDAYWEIIEREYAWPDSLVEDITDSNPWHVSGAVDDQKDSLK